jgi:hypothetical protein
MVWSIVSTGPGWNLVASSYTRKCLRLSLTGARAKTWCLIICLEASPSVSVTVASTKSWCLLLIYTCDTRGSVSLTLSPSLSLSRWPQGLGFRVIGKLLRRRSFGNGELHALTPRRRLVIETYTPPLLSST